MVNIKFQGNISSISGKKCWKPRRAIPSLQRTHDWQGCRSWSRQVWQNKFGQAPSVENSFIVLIILNYRWFKPLSFGFASDTLVLPSLSTLVDWAWSIKWPRQSSALGMGRPTMCCWTCVGLMAGQHHLQWHRWPQDIFGLVCLLQSIAVGYSVGFVLDVFCILVNFAHGSEHETVLSMTSKWLFHVALMFLDVAGF